MSGKLNNQQIDNITNEISIAFKNADKDNNGFLDRKEFAKLIAQTGKKFSSDESKMLFSFFDGDGSDKIHFDEFSRNFKIAFQK